MKLTKKKLKEYFAKERSNHSKKKYIKWLENKIINNYNFDAINWCDIEYVTEGKARESGFYHKQIIEGVMRSTRIPDKDIWGTLK